MLFSVPPLNKYMCLKSPDGIIQIVTWGKSDGTSRLGEGIWESETSLMSCSCEILSCFFLAPGETSSFCVCPPSVMTGWGAADGGFAQACDGPTVLSTSAEGSIQECYTTVFHLACAVTRLLSRIAMFSRQGSERQIVQTLEVMVLLEILVLCVPPRFSIGFSCHFWQCRLKTKAKGFCSSTLFCNTLSVPESFLKQEVAEDGSWK